VIHLILGGARSGKSSFAEQKALEVLDAINLRDTSSTSKPSKKIIYVATATADDVEMEQRIAHHQSRRGYQWRLIEEPFYLSKVISEERQLDPFVQVREVLLIDCMTLWVSNWLCKEPCKKTVKNSQRSYDDLWGKEKNAFLCSLEKSGSTIFIVSNEIGSGIVPLGELNRDFVDRAGWLNQEIAKIANKVTLVVAGLPVALKNCTVNQ